MRIDTKRHPGASVGVLALLGFALAGLLVVLVAVPARAELSAVSPGTDRTGYPSWYQDDTGRRVNLCVDNRLCLGGDTRPNRNKPASPTVDANPNRAGLQPNMPDEAFFAAAEAETELDAGGRIRWRGVLEGAYSSAQPRAGREITFTRMQVTGSNIDPGDFPQGLTFVTPYGEMTGTVDADGTLRTRVESRLGVRANGFNEPVIETVTGYGPTILRWDPAVAPAAPAGFLGNPLRLHSVVGGDLPDPQTGVPVNAFRVFEGNSAIVGAEASPLVTQFTIAGRCDRPNPC